MIPTGPLCLNALLVVAASSALPPPQYGSVEILTEPAALVIWEGVELATTDSAGILLIQDIPLGSYSLTLEKEGYEPLRTRLEVRQERTSVRLPLERLLPPPSTTAGGTAGTPDEAPAAEVAGEPAPPPPERAAAAADPPPPAAAADSLAPAAADGTIAGSGRWTAPALLAGILAAAGGALLLRRARQPRWHAPPAPHAGPGRAAPRPMARPTDDSLVDQMKRREEDLEEARGTDRRQHPVIIEAHDFQVLDEDS